MVIIHVMNGFTKPRLLDALVADSMRVMPAVVITGARQTGKSTLARALGPASRRFHTLDDIDVLDLAKRNPQALIDGTHGVTLDEIQRAPELLLSVKSTIDRNRQAGRFVMTGSANLLMMQNVSESLAGRAAYCTLWPMTRREQQGAGRAGLWSELFDTDPELWPELLSDEHSIAEDWKSLARRGGFPTPALQLRTARDRAIWFEGYARTYVERDLRDIAAVASLPDFRRLMIATTLRLGQVLNQTELGRDTAIPQPTVHRWLNALETSYLLVRLPAYAINRTKRLIKSPKLYWSDTGLAMHIAGHEQPTGAMLENVILSDLLAWRDGSSNRAELYYWRTHAGEEIDFVVENNTTLLPIEIKATAKPRLSHAQHLLSFRAEYGSRVPAALLLHTGSTIEWLAPGILAVPWWRVV